MTTARLISLVRRYPSIRDANLRIEPDDILAPGSWTQEDILRRVEPIIAKGSLELVVGQEVYTSAEEPWLVSAGRFLNVAYYTDTTKKHLIKRDVSWVDKDRTRIAEGGTKSLPPRFFYILETNPKSIGIWYIPDAVFEINFRYFQRHAVANNLADGVAPVNPIIPDNLEEALVVGTVEKIFEMRGRKFASERDDAHERYERIIAGKIEEYGIQNAAILVDEGLIFG